MAPMSVPFAGQADGQVQRGGGRWAPITLAFIKTGGHGGKKMRKMLTNPRVSHYLNYHSHLLIKAWMLPVNQEPSHSPFAGRKARCNCSSY